MDKFYTSSITSSIQFYPFLASGASVHPPHVVAGGAGPPARVRPIPSSGPEARPATVPGLWLRCLLDVRWDIVGGLSGASWRQV